MSKKDFDAQAGDRQLREENQGVQFNIKVREAIRSSIDVQKEIKVVIWALIKEKVAWVIFGGFSFAMLELLKELARKLIARV